MARKTTNRERNVVVGVAEREGDGLGKTTSRKGKRAGLRVELLVVIIIIIY